MDGSIVLKFGGSIQDPADFEFESNWIEEKIREEKTRYDPATQLTRQNLVKTWLQPVDFCFCFVCFTKTTSF
jgi:hypothetical protein